MTIKDAGGNGATDPDLLIRSLDPATDLAAVIRAYAEAADYWTLADRRAPDATTAAAFFTDCPPGSDPAQSQRLGLFVDGRLAGIAELSFGFPAPQDAYLGSMILAPWARNHGYGRVLLAEVEHRASAAGSTNLYLAVLLENPKGRAFWERQGFVATGLSGHDPSTGHTLHRLLKVLQKKSYPLA
jgi:ribosomal protein S18 acetylase RimI-like enzyme